MTAPGDERDALPFPHNYAGPGRVEFEELYRLLADLELRVRDLEGRDE